MGLRRAIINISLYMCRDRLYTSESDVYKSQILTSKVNPRAVRVNVEIASQTLAQHWLSIG